MNLEAALEAGLSGETLNNGRALLLDFRGVGSAADADTQAKRCNAIIEHESMASITNSGVMVSS